jgi:hypothetical protein
VGARPDALTAAIDKAWRVFDIPAPATTGVCEHCCLDPKIEADFLKKKARDLRGDYVRDWYFAARSDQIRHDHVAWFLPRVMEMLAQGETIATVGHEVIFQRLHWTGFPDRWPRDEVAAVQGFAEAFFDAVLDNRIPGADQDLDSWLCMFGQGGIDIAPLLRLMDALPDDALAARLHQMWWHVAWGDISVDAFWDEGPAKTLAWNWYTSAHLLARMERAAMAGDERALEVHSVIATARANDDL